MIIRSIITIMIMLPHSKYEKIFYVMNIILWVDYKIQVLVEGHNIVCSVVIIRGLILYGARVESLATLINNMNF